MALNIKDPHTDALARTLAREAGEPLTTATRIAIEERLARLRAQRPTRETHDDLAAIIDRGRRRPLLSNQSEDEILGYGADGIPG
ncbi:type II toxin-antitoxin system VapB family antitoxin [soil metagenome]